MDASTYVIVALLVVLVFFMFRNRRKRANEQAELQKKIVPGVEVMLTFGIYGTIVSIDEENNVAEVEVAPGTVIKVHRQTLGRVVEPVAVTASDDAEPVAETSTYSLNKDSAIPAEPSYGERRDATDDDTKN